MEYNSGSPIYLQVINELKKKMVKGELKPGEKNAIEQGACSFV